MSYLDVQVLRRFSQKLAAANAESELKLIPADGKEVTPVVPTSQATRIEQSRHKGLAAQNTLQSKLLRGLGSVGDKAKSVGQQAMHGVNAATQNLPDLQTLGYGAGGAALGSLGAMGLANLLRSKKEEDEEQGTPWLAGIAGAGLGGAAGIYLPQLLAALTGNKAP